MTALATAGVSAADGSRLCVLGAGNCYDLDLPRLTAVYREVHLADIDREALDAARDRQPPEVREKLVCHGPLDLSGVLGEIERWKRLEVTLQELVAAPEAASARVASALPGPFDVVVSACLLTQLQLAALNILSDRHRLFAAVRQTVSLIHLRTLVRLLAPGGRALLVTDLTSNVTYPLQRVDPKADMLALMRALVRNGNVIYAAHPELLSTAFREDPFASRLATLGEPSEAWLWNNGPERVFLVYAMTITRRGDTEPASPKKT